MGSIIKNFGEAIESTLGIPIEFSMMISIAIVGYVVYLLIKWFVSSLSLVLQLRKYNNDAFFVKAKFQKVSNDLISMWIVLKWVGVTWNFKTGAFNRSAISP